MNKNIIPPPRAMEGCGKPALGMFIIGLAVSACCILSIPQNEWMRIFDSISSFILNKP